MPKTFCPDCNGKKAKEYVQCPSCVALGGQPKGTRNEPRGGCDFCRYGKGGEYNGVEYPTRVCECRQVKWTCDRCSGTGKIRNPDMCHTCGGKGCLNMPTQPHYQEQYKKHGTFVGRFWGGNAYRDDLGD